MEREPRNGLSLTIPFMQDEKQHKLEEIESNCDHSTTGTTSFFKTCFNELNALSGCSSIQKMDKTVPNLNNQTDTNELVSVENPAIIQKPNLRRAWRLFFEHYPPLFLRKVVAEIIATFLLVFVTCGSAALSASDESRVSQLGASVAGGLIVTVMIYAVGHVSGAHMNPAVTLAFAAARHFPWKQVPFYAAAQLTGAISAAFTLRVLLHPIKHVGTTSPSGTEIQALVMEIVVTFSMMFVTSAVATDTKAVGELAGLAVGSAVCISSILAGPVSGGSMNPARTLGPAIASRYYKGIWVYLVGPVSGTLLGVLSYNLIRVPVKPVHASSSHSSWFKHGRMRRDSEQVANEEDLLNMDCPQ